jgi:hypothetical protein
MFYVYAKTELFENTPLGLDHLVLIVIIILVDRHRFYDP